MKKLLIAVSAVLSATALFATEYAAVSFSSSGTDTYADGTLVPDGEVYALVWSAGEFAGFNADGSLKNPEDVVIPVTLKKGEGVVFNLPADSKLVTGGTLAAYLIDTRKIAEDGTKTVAGLTDGKLAYVAESAKFDQVVKPQTGATPVEVAAGETTKEAAEKSDLPAGAPIPVIANMEVAGEKIILTVQNTAPYATYVAQGGATIGAKDQIGAAVTGNGKTIKLVYPKTAANAFIKVIAK